jgi:predicted O-methyltransferase YrrM
LLSNPWMAERETLWLIEQAKPSSFVAEIGCWAGLTTVNVASQTSATYYCVDTWPDADKNTDKAITWELSHHENGWLYSLFLSNTSALKNIKVVRLPSTAAATFLSHVEFDMVFIDADHTYQSCYDDICAWAPLVKKDGLLCGHDYNTGQGVLSFGTNKAVDELLPRRSIVPSTSIWYVRR